MTDGRRMMKTVIAIAVGVVVIVSISACNGCNPESFGEINGTVYFIQHQRLIYATVRTVPPTISVMTDMNANFSIPNVQPGVYKVIAEYGTANSGSAYVTVHPNKTSTVVIIVRPNLLEQ